MERRLTITAKQTTTLENRKKISVAIIEEYCLTRMLFKQILINDRNKEFEVVNDFSDAGDFIQNASENNLPDVIMMNLSFSSRNDIGKIRDIRVKYPNIKILVITTHEEINEIITCLELGVLGYILKDAARETIKEGIKQAYLDKIFIDPNITRRIERQKMNLAG